MTEYADKPNSWLHQHAIAMVNRDRIHDDPECLAEAEECIRELDARGAHVTANLCVGVLADRQRERQGEDYAEPMPRTWGALDG